jgi:hypothetical protein
MIERHRFVVCYNVREIFEHTQVIDDICYRTRRLLITDGTFTSIYH